MRKLLACTLCLLAVSLWGCSKDAPADDTLKSTAPVNNNAPEAKNAPAAPRDPSIMMPGGGGGGGKKMPKQ
jgi:hypothetical protein